MPRPAPPKGRTLEQTRRGRRLLALRELGLTVDAPRTLAQHVEAMGRENYLQSLPEDASTGIPLQNSAGHFRYLPGFSDPGGPDWF